MKWIVGCLALGCAFWAACGEDGALAIQPAEQPAEVERLRGWYGAALQGAVDAESAKRIAAAEPDVERALSETDDRKAGEAIARVAASGLDPKDVRALLLLGPSTRPKARTGLFQAKAAVPGFAGKQVGLSVNCPADYDPKQAWPLIVSLHGMMGTGDNYIGIWGNAKDAGKYLIVAPSAELAYGWGPSRFGQAQVLAAMNWARENYRIDPDRVYLEGMSMGGAGTKRIALVMADRFAAICSRSGPPVRANMASVYRNLVPLGVMGLAGAADPMVPVSALKTEDASMRAAGVEHRFKAVEGRGHDVFMELNDSVLAFFGTRNRTPCPEKLAFASYEDGWGASYFWLEIAETDRRANATHPEYVGNIATFVNGGGAPKNAPAAQKDAVVDTLSVWNSPREAAAHLDRAANAVVLDAAKSIARLRIYVGDEMADLDREVSVVGKGRTLAKKKIARDVRFMLQEARKRGRRDQAWWGVLDVSPAR